MVQAERPVGCQGKPVEVPEENWLEYIISSWSSGSLDMGV